MIIPTLDQLVKLAERFDMYVDDKLCFCSKRNDGSYAIIDSHDYIYQYDIVEIVNAYDNCIVGRSENFGGMEIDMKFYVRQPVSIDNAIYTIDK